jgi:superoxide reductase
MERRVFLKGSVLAVGTIIAGTAIRAEAAAKFPPGLIYTRDNPGRWVNLVNIHTPAVSMDAGRVKIVTPHPMSLQHFIVKHVLLTEDGLVLGERTFAYTDSAPPTSYYELMDGFHGNLWATSFCNLHDLWLTEFKV